MLRHTSTTTRHIALIMLLLGIWQTIVPIAIASPIARKSKETVPKSTKTVSKAPKKTKSPKQTSVPLTPPPTSSPSPTTSSPTKTPTSPPTPDGCGDLYAVSRRGDLYTIDPETWSGTLVGSTGFGKVTAIDFHPETKVLYGIERDDHELITIDTTTGQGTKVANLIGDDFNLEIGIPDISFDPSGTLYLWTEDIDGLATVNITSGDVTLTGTTDPDRGSYSTGLAINSSNEMYVRYGEHLWRINDDTNSRDLLGEFTRVYIELQSGGSLSLPYDVDSFELGNNSNMLAFDRCDNLWTGTRNGDLDSSFLLQIDIDTLGFYLFGDTGIDELTALAFSYY